MRQSSLRFAGILIVAACILFITDIASVDVGLVGPALDVAEADNENITMSALEKAATIFDGFVSCNSPQLEQWLVQKEFDYGGVVKNVKCARGLHKPGEPIICMGGDRMNSKFHHYAPCYAHWLNKFCMLWSISPADFPLLVAEVGILKGSGLAIWSDLFPATSRIHGFDLDLSNTIGNVKTLKSRGAFIKNNLDLHTVNQLNDNSALVADVSGSSKYSFVIDDGYHTLESLNMTFASFKPRLATDALYIIEDFADGKAIQQIIGNNFEAHSCEADGRFWAITRSSTDSADHRGTAPVRLLVNSFSYEAFRQAEVSPKLAKVAAEIKGTKPYVTMVTLNNILAMAKLITFIDKHDVKGDVMEAGTWKGGTSLFIKRCINESRSSRRLWLFDSFQGFGQNNKGADAVFNHINNSAGGYQVVVDLFRRNNMLDSQVNFVRGFFNETMPLIDPSSRFAIIRLDSDMYTSLSQSLCYTYDLLEIGGFTVINDWGTWPQCRHAVGDFLKAIGADQEHLHCIHGKNNCDPWHHYDLVIGGTQMLKGEDNMGSIWWQKTIPSSARQSKFCKDVV